MQTAYRSRKLTLLVYKETLTIMAKKKHMPQPSEIPPPEETPEFLPPPDPDILPIPEEAPDVIPEDDPFENPPPFEIPPPGEGP